MTTGNISISIPDGWITSSTLDLGNSSYYNNYYTVGAIGTSASSSVNITGTGIEMQEDADIQLGHRSLKDFMNKVEERLNILQPNKQLESEWDELKELGERYRALEKELQEKAQVWGILKDTDGKK